MMEENRQKIIMMKENRQKNYQDGTKWIEKQKTQRKPRLKDRKSLERNKMDRKIENTEESPG